MYFQYSKNCHFNDGLVRYLGHSFILDQQQLDASDSSTSSLLINFRMTIVFIIILNLDPPNIIKA